MVRRGDPSPYHYPFPNEDSPVLRTDSEPARSTRLREAERTAPSSRERDSIVRRKMACERLDSKPCGGWRKGLVRRKMACERLGSPAFMLVAPTERFLAPKSRAFWMSPKSSIT